LASPDLNSLAQYVALKVVSGNGAVLKAVEEYLIGGQSPSKVAYKYGLSKYQLRGYAQRIIEKCGSEHTAKMLLPTLISVASTIEPTLKKVDEVRYNCSKCKISLTKDEAEEHVKQKHKDDLSSATIKFSNSLALAQVMPKM
jgi:transposase-like protein